MNELGIEIEDNMILEARQIVFNDACRQYLSELSNANIDIHPNLQLNNRRMGPTDSSRSHAIEMVFVFIATEHAGSSARSCMLSWK